MKLHPSKRLVGILFILIGACVALCQIPAPLGGYWHTQLTDCLCDSKNLLKFENGETLWWATGNKEIAGAEIVEKIGVYKRISFYWYELSGGEIKIRVKPGWLLMKMEDNGLILRGWRELRPWYISEVLNTKKKPNKK